jgi:imidazolonepropionase-like amidohydrolase
MTELVIAGAQVFDGENLLGEIDVQVSGEMIRAVGGSRPDGFEVVDGSGATLLAGMLDPRTHGSAGGLRHALAFGSVSLRKKLRLLVLAGLRPTEALRAAIALPADRFGLTDRGRIQAGLRAHLVLVDGEPTVTIGDTLSIRAVWRQGTRLAVEPAGAHA